MLSVAAIQDPQRLAQELGAPDALAKFARRASGDARKVLHGDGRFDFADAATGGMPDAPIDGGVYGRVNVTWTPVLALSGGTMAGPLRLAQHPQHAFDASTKGYTDSKLPLDGGTLTGPLNLAREPKNDREACSKLYVDGKLSRSGGVLTGPLALASPHSRYEIANSQESFSVSRVGTTSSDFVLSADTAAFVAAGHARKPGGGMWGDVIDARLVQVVGNYTAGLAAVLNLYPVRYRFRGNDTARKSKAASPPYPESPHCAAARSGEVFYGLVGQDIEAAVPDMVRNVHGLLDNTQVFDIRAMDYSPLLMALVNAVRELATANRVLAERVSALEAKR